MLTLPSLSVYKITVPIPIIITPSNALCSAIVIIFIITFINIEIDSIKLSVIFPSSCSDIVVTIF